MNPRTDSEFFDAKYRADPDPWKFDTHWYEIRKRNLLMALLPEQHYRSALEPGCANGHITSALATRCGQVIATDIAPHALSLARDRCAGITNVSFHHWAFGDPWCWDREFDLVFLSEVAYYLPAPVLAATVSDMSERLTAGTTIVLSHWRHAEHDHHLTGDQANDIALSALNCAPTAAYADADVRIDIVIPSPERD
ncbi:class I SAM-dependent methyltransferase [Nocardia sp. NBC_01327]|uniref:class I SAM-dependent methyltransferase n=1 Tax=Nocardia sp. NBC_01327 TaxID=2903593 RepID=UPI002E1253B9|nr:class I SAM-dependent methyltransferase [Nocardia sp. NBC_01327]